MVKNNSHNSESREHRLARLQSSPVEAIETLLCSLASYFNNEIQITPENHQTTLLILGIHAVALTIGEVFFNNSGNNKDLKNYKDFLKTFVDGDTPDTKFSTVGDDIHHWRNVLAHQWLSSLGHSIEYEYDMDLGWKIEDDILIINPKIYCDKYLGSFARGGRLWKYGSIFSQDELQKIHQRIVRKYENR